MGLAIAVILFILGIVLVVKGGDIFVDAASWIAEVSGIPKILIGATIVSLATTLPEMLVSVIAATRGDVDMSIGNAVGSVTANIGLIMALALIFMPGVIRRRDYLLKSCLMLAAALMIVFCGLYGQINLTFSLILLFLFAVFMIDNIFEAKKHIDLDAAKEPDEPVTKKKVGINIAKFVIGAACIVFGADLLVDNGSTLARLVGISERIIGVTVIAVGTSLPELITTITAIRKKQAELSVGNILGANIMDLTLILPLSSLISGRSLPIAHTSAIIDLPACLLVGFFAIVPAMLSAKFRRWQGVALLTLYGAFVTITCGL